MYTPSKVLTKHGVNEHNMHLQNLRNALFWITNNDDDLHISCSEEGDKIIRLIYELQELIGHKTGLLDEGDGEEFDE